MCEHVYTHYMYIMSVLAAPHHQALATNKSLRLLDLSGNSLSVDSCAVMEDLVKVSI